MLVNNKHACAGLKTIRENKNSNIWGCMHCKLKLGIHYTYSAIFYNIQRTTYSQLDSVLNIEICRCRL